MTIIQRNLLSNVVVFCLLAGLFSACGTPNISEESSETKIVQGCNAYTGFYTPFDGTVIAAYQDTLLVEQDHARMLCSMDGEVTVDPSAIAAFYQDDTLYSAFLGENGIVSLSLPDGFIYETEYDASLGFIHGNYGVQFASGKDGVMVQLGRQLYFCSETELIPCEISASSGASNDVLGIAAVADTIYVIASVRSAEDVAVTCIYRLDSDTAQCITTLNSDISPIFVAGSDSKLYFIANDILYSWTPEKLVQECVLSELGVSTSGMIALAASGNNIRLVYSNGYETLTPSTVVQESSDISNNSEPIPSPQNKKITMVYIDSPLRSVSSDVAAFNRSRDDITVNATAVSSVADINLSLVAGDIPDILCTGDDLNTMQNYASKGALCGLNSLIDSAFPESDYLVNILAAGSIGEQIYYITPSFSLSGIALPKILVPETGVFESMEEFYEALDQAEEEPYGSLTKETMLNLLLNDSNEAFVDYATASCSFNSTEFEAYLEFCNHFANTEEEVIANMSGTRATLAVASISNYETFVNSNAIMRYKTPYQCNVAYCPAPCSGYRGLGIQGSYYIGISSTSNSFDAAATFLEYILSEDCQQTTKNSFPVKRSACEYYLSQNEAYSSQNEMAVLLWSYLEQADHYSGVQISMISEIALEEATAYFGGDKTAEEVSEIIQNRVSIYLSEQAE